MTSPEETPTEEASDTQASSSRVSLETFYEQYTVKILLICPPPPLVIGPSTCKKIYICYKPLPSSRVRANCPPPHFLFFSSLISLASLALMIIIIMSDNDHNAHAKANDNDNNSEFV